MQHKMTKTLVAGAVALAANSALALEAGDWIARAGAAHVNPDASSDALTSAAVAGGTLDVDSATALGVTLGYMYTDHIGVGLLLATPFEHDIEGDGSISAVGKLVEADQLPPTLTLQYHFTPKSNIRPYVGAGINYTIFFSEDGTGALAGHSVELEDSWGLAAEAGIDIDINDKWFVSGQLWYLDIDTEADISGALVNENGLDVEIDPWVVMIGIGTTF